LLTSYKNEISAGLINTFGIFCYKIIKNTAGKSEEKRVHLGDIR
jgi:hypothetical protein